MKKLCSDQSLTSAQRRELWTAQEWGHLARPRHNPSARILEQFGLVAWCEERRDYYITVRGYLFPGGQWQSASNRLFQSHNPNLGNYMEGDEYTPPPAAYRIVE